MSQRLKSWLEPRSQEEGFTIDDVQYAGEAALNEQVVGLDGFAYSASDPDARWHRVIDTFLEQHPQSLFGLVSRLHRSNSVTNPEEASHLLRVLAARAPTNTEKWGQIWNHLNRFDIRDILAELTKALISADCPPREVELQTLLAWYRKAVTHWKGTRAIAKLSLPAPLLRRLESLAAIAPLSRELQNSLREMEDLMIPDLDVACRYRDLFEIPLRATDVWACRVLEESNGLSDAQYDAWVALLKHCDTASASKPAAKWLKTADNLLRNLGGDEFRQRLRAWLPLSAKARQCEALKCDREEGYRSVLVDDWELDDFNTDVLRGLIWCASLSGGMELPSVLASAAIGAYRKIPVRGARAPKIGNAAVWVLGNLPGLEGTGALSVLKTRVKFATAQKLIDAALTQIAEREGLPRDEIEELAVPGYGMETVGLRSEQLGEFTAELRVVAGGATELLWRKADGKLQKSVPAGVKDDYADDLKDLKQAALDIQKQLPAQKDRLDKLFIQQKSWPYPLWRERYLDHPLVGILAHRLIWCFERDGVQRQGIYYQDALRDRNGQELGVLDEHTRVSLWHPLNKPPAEVLAWREWLEQRQISQPLKQAHREVYLLTDAERATRTYSNRFAAHILKQHQFNALCATRGWRNRLHVEMDEDYPGNARRELPQWNLRAEYWIEGIMNPDGRGETNEVGVYLYVGTDQVRFYPLAQPENGQPLALEEVPPLAFSEIMRDVDLFVGVAGVGNDPAWADGGEGGRYRDYWHGYAFGDLNESARTRHDVLSRLLPRLKISARCTLDNRFLEVRGDLRSYRIHLGSGNILMAPNDQYLCIVTARGKAADQVFLPFEGDAMLSVILSKAFLLAEDKKITDPTILNQIHAGV